MTAIILEADQRLRTVDLPHKKIVIGCSTWLACKLPAGDYAFHQHSNFDHDGYGGNPVEFLLENGDIETFHGPYRRYDLAILGADPIAERLLGIPGCSVQATKLTVGKNLGRWMKTPEIVYRETCWRLGNWKDRVRPEWRGMEFAVTKRECVFYPSVDEVKEMFRDPRLKQPKRPAEVKGISDG